MSTLTGEEHTGVIQQDGDLYDYFNRFIKSRENRLIGIEAEFFVVEKETGKALPFEGPRGIEMILEKMAKRFSYEMLKEKGRTIGLKRGDTYIALEPGGQMELSAPPVKNIFDIERQIENFRSEIRGVSQDFPNACWIAFGVHPVSRIEEIAWVPKERYAIMADCLSRSGTLSHHMMKRTCTNHFNFDYTSEADAMDCLRTVFGITSIVTALFARSSFSQGKVNGFMSERLEIWNHTSPERSGLRLEFLKRDLKFKDYLDFILDLPVFFIVRDKKWQTIGNMTFRQFIRGGASGRRATIGDFELHLSTAFPEVRLKTYLEVRGLDCQDPKIIPAAAAFWKGILYDEKVRRKAWELVSDASDKERLLLHRDVPKKGLRAKLGNKPISEIAAQLLELSKQGLAAQPNPQETLFIDRIIELTANGTRSPAELVSGEDIKRLIESLSLG